MTDREKFAKGVVVICDTREQKNSHIISALDKLGIKHKTQKLDYGDYSFTFSNRICSLDFRQTCVVERKANVDEVYSNIIDDRKRIEKEMQAISCLARQCTFIIENCSDWEELKNYKLSDFVMLASDTRKKQDIGLPCYETLDTWRRGKRDKFEVEFVEDKRDTATGRVSSVCRYWDRYRERTKRRDRLN